MISAAISSAYVLYISRPADMDSRTPIRRRARRIVRRVPTRAVALQGSRCSLMKASSSASLTTLLRIDKGRSLSSRIGRSSSLMMAPTHGCMA